MLQKTTIPAAPGSYTVGVLDENNNLVKTLSYVVQAAVTPPTISLSPTSATVVEGFTGAVSTITFDNGGDPNALITVSGSSLEVDGNNLTFTEPASVSDTGASTVTITNSAGSAQAIFNSTVTAAAGTAPSVLSSPTITGGQYPGDTLTATNGTFSGNPTPTVTGQWFLGAAQIVGETGPTYTLLQSDIGSQVTFRNTATNAEGTVTATSNAISVVAVPAIAAATYGINTEAGQGATIVDAPDGTYDNGNLQVTGGLMTRAVGGTLTAKTLTVGNTTVALVAGKSCSNWTEFVAFMGETRGTTLLTYPRVIMSGTINAPASFNWNNHFRNLPVGFEMIGAYGTENSDLFPICRKLLIQTSGVVATAPVISGLKLRGIHFYDVQDTTVTDLFVPPKNYLFGHRTRLENLDIQYCRFSTDQRAARDGGTFAVQMNAVRLEGNAFDTIMEHNEFANLSYPLEFRGDGLLFRFNDMRDLWADFFKFENGARRAWLCFNHMQTPVGDGTYLHGDMFQIQATSTNDNDVEEIYIFGNTFTPGEYVTKAFSQAEARIAATNQFSTAKAFVLVNQSRVLVAPADQGSLFNFDTQTNTTAADQTLTLPPAAANAGFITGAKNRTQGHTVRFIPDGSDTIAGGAGLLNYLDDLAIYSDGTSEWKILPPGLRQNNVIRQSGHTLNLLDNECLTLVSAANGAATINLPATGVTTHRYLVKKNDSTANAVTINATNGLTISKAETGQTGLSSLSLTLPGAATLFIWNGTVWTAEDATITLQAVFANPHAGGGEYRKIWVFGNIMLPLSANGLAIETGVEDGIYAYNTMARFIPDDANGDGVVGRAEGWDTSGAIGNLTLRNKMVSYGNIIAGRVNTNITADPDIQAGVNYEIGTGIGNLKSAEDVRAEQVRLFVGGPNSWQPITRQQMIAAFETNNSDVNGLGAHVVTDWDNNTINLPRIAPDQVFPARGAPAVPLNAVLQLKLTQHVDISAASIVLRNVTDNVVVPATVTTDRLFINIAPNANLIDAKTYRVEIAGTGVIPTMTTVTDPVFGALPITTAGPMNAIGGTDWTFVANANSYTNAITTYTPSGGRVDDRILGTEGIVLNGLLQLDSNFDPAEGTENFPAQSIVRTRITGTSGTAIYVFRLFGPNAGTYTTSINMATGVVTTNAPLGAGANATADGWELWTRFNGVGQTRYYLYLATSGTTPGLKWSETVIIPANQPQSPFVSGLAAWDVVGPVLSSDNTLTSLVPSVGSLIPTFDSATTSYAISVANGVTSITLTPTANDAAATITVNGVAVASGAASGPISLAVGANTVNVVVTAENGSTRTYATSITRAAAAGVAFADSLVPVDYAQAPWDAAPDGNGWVIQPAGNIRADTTEAAFTAPATSGTITAVVDIRKTAGGVPANFNIRMQNTNTGQNSVPQFRNDSLMGTIVGNTGDAAISSTEDASGSIDLGGGVFRCWAQITYNAGNRMIIDLPSTAEGECDCTNPAIFEGALTLSEIENLA